MRLRPGGTADLDAIMALERASFQGDAWSETAMRAELASPHNHYIVAEQAGRLVGYAGLRAPDGAKDADVQTIALDRSARGRGRGRTLFRALLAEASRRGVREVFLDVRADNPPAQRLYASEGFLEIGRRPNYYPDGNVDAIVMRLDVPGWAAARASSSPMSENRADVGESGANPPTSGRISDERGEAGACT
ncbi:MAG: ribosomal-protein-alanine N-acetyltransferase [Microbacterium sp.]|uniref:ribosomal protein S18-alanine N-acetyltransferase n=1 Tax=Microbacterium xanthum TaxID=3079794 RepID=UPI000C8C3906|nr:MULTISPECIES: ribosomal protein S18-alanine N-acetyltransferase [unclassified Microbacterium]MAP62902.1 ribosomal-protein-alanine N-acetyltransferase [Microbacterium sp.]MDZ8170857.1 ribosomal protein S18-alanine N-acetyltransferase [Microbacterium sp. KSW-48]MDZ8201369.1 ribosomal protein S18-alanine N-acetyltransferase [Microbacterium sp. SSW1-59]|tara:strand:- start:207 stop:782 length:576 start_codon:yes stop_codon:yes gene_type:complete